MNSWINFSILWMLTGSPVAAAVILLAAYAIADWYTFGFLRGVAREYETELPYQRRRDRLWAWRARPSRPLIYAACACCALAVFGAALQRSAAPPAHAAADVRSTPTPTSSARPAR